MDKYLTTKAKTGRLVRLAENAAALTLAATLMLWTGIAVFGFLADGFMPVTHILMVLVAIPFILLLSWLLERKRARIHARAIAGAMCVREDSIPLEELEKITGVRNLEKEIAKLAAKGLLTNIVVLRGVVQTAASKTRQAACAYCGASLTFRGERVEHCPNCGSGAIKY